MSRSWPRGGEDRLGEDMGMEDLTGEDTGGLRPGIPGKPGPCCCLASRICLLSSMMVSLFLLCHCACQGLGCLPPGLGGLLLTAGLAAAPIPGLSWLKKFRSPACIIGLNIGLVARPSPPLWLLDRSKGLVVFGEALLGSLCLISDSSSSAPLFLESPFSWEFSSVCLASMSWAAWSWANCAAYSWGLRAISWAGSRKGEFF